jgi:hypothetical protein
MTGADVGTILWIGVIVVGWVVLSRFVLPKLGIPT